MTTPTDNPGTPWIDRQKYRLQSGQYLKTAKPKSLVALHHTAGGSAGSTFKWWNEGDPRRIGTAFLVARDGTIFEIFDPKFWAWHLGVKDDQIEKRSIGIEICNWGQLTEKGGHLHTWSGRNLGNIETLVHAGTVAHFPTPWRGGEYYEAYSQDQIDAVCGLVPWLCEKYQIPNDLPEKRHLTGPANVPKFYTFRGVLHHAMLRKDKSDITPNFPWSELEEALR